MKKEYIIEQVSKGELDLENDGTLEQLKELLTLAFPKDKTRLSGYSKFYRQALYYPNLWMPYEKSTHPTQSVKDFFEWKPERGEMVLVRDHDSNEWDSRIFLVEITGATRPFVTVARADQDEFNKGLTFGFIPWRQMKQIEKTKPEAEKASTWQERKTFKPYQSVTLNIQIENGKDNICAAIKEYIDTYIDHIEKEQNQ